MANNYYDGIDHWIYFHIINLFGDTNFANIFYKSIDWHEYYSYTYFMTEGVENMVSKFLLQMEIIIL
jgi:hypothetical protein